MMLRTAQSPTAGFVPTHASSRPPLRAFASGTIFVTQKLLVSSYPEAGGVARAQNVQKTRGGHSANVLAILTQFYLKTPTNPSTPNSNVIIVSATGGLATRSVGDVQFCGPLPGNDEGNMITKQLEAQKVGTLFSIVREGKGVPTAWLIQSGTPTLFLPSLFCLLIFTFSGWHQDSHVSYLFYQFEITS